MAFACKEGYALMNEWYKACAEAVAASTPGAIKAAKAKRAATAEAYSTHRHNCPVCRKTIETGKLS